jgi:hypothetical protein
MPWEVPITVGDQTYPVQFNTEAEPTQTDIDEAVAQILSGQQGQTAPAEVEDTGQSRFSSAMSNLGRGALSIIPGAIGGLGYLAEPVIGPGLKEVGEDIEQDIEKMLPVNPAYQGEFTQKGFNAAGQALSMLATGGVVGALGKGAAVARGLGAAEAAAAGTQLAGRTLLGSGFLSGAREGGQEAERYGMEGLSAYSRALLGGAIEGLTEKYTFGLGTELSPVKKFLGDTLEKGAGGLVKAIGTESGEEALAQVGGNIATKLLAPAGVETPGITEGVGEAAALGGVGGGVVGGIGTLLPSAQKEEAAAPAVGSVDVTPEEPLPTAFVNLDNAVKAAVDADTGEVDKIEADENVLPVTAAVLKEVTPEAPPAVADAKIEETPAPAVVSQTPPISEQQTELSVEGETQTAAPEQPVSTEPPIAEAPVVTGAAEEVKPLPETEKPVAPEAVTEQGGGMPKPDNTPAFNRFVSDLDFYGTAKFEDSQFTVKQASDETFYVEKTANGERTVISSGFPDLEGARKSAVESARQLSAEASSVRQSAPTVESKPEERGASVEAIASGGGMSVEEARAYLERKSDTGEPLVFGRPWSEISGMQQGDRPAALRVADKFKAAKQIVRDIARFKIPVDVSVANAYGITLPEGYVREGDLYVYRPESLPSTETAPQTTTPKPQDASIQNEVQEAGGPTPVQGQPPQTRAEDQAQEGAAQRSREGEEGQQVLTPKVDPNTPEFGSTNTVFTKEKAEEARKVLRRKLGGQFNLPAFDPELFSAATNYAGYLIEGGVRSIADFSANMVKEFGEGIRPYIKGLYNGVRDIAEFEGMDDAIKADEFQKLLEKDAEYLTAVEAGDTEKAQRTVEEAAKAESGSIQWSRKTKKFQGDSWEVTVAKIFDEDVEFIMQNGEPRFSGKDWWILFNQDGEIDRVSGKSYGTVTPSGDMQSILKKEAARILQSKSPLGERIFLRFGSIPKGGKSRNFVTGDLEKGVSVYAANWNPAFSTYELADADHAGTAIDLISQGKKPSFYSGEVVGRGSDGEPVLNNPKKLADARFSKNGFSVASDLNQPFAPTTYDEKRDTRGEKAPEAKPLPASFGSTNTLFTVEGSKEASKVLRRKLGQANVPIFDADLFQAAVYQAGFYIEGGVKGFADFSARMVEDFGEAVRPYLKSAYNAVRDYAVAEKMDEGKFAGMDDASKVNEVLGEATPAAPAAAAPVAAPPLARSEPKQETPKVTPTGKASPAEVVDLRRSAMDEERKRLGLPPLAQPIQKAIGDDQMYDLAMQEFEKNPLIGSTLVDMVNTRPRSLNSLEIAILGIEIANRRNAVDMADNAASADPKNQALQDEYQKAVARYDDAQQALPLGISDVGRALRLMRVLLEQDFSKEGLIRKFRQSSGGVAPNEQQVKEIEQVSAEILDAENNVEELRAARAENARLQETIDNMLTHMKANFVKELQAVEKANKEASEAIKTASKPGKGEKSSLAIWKEKILARRAERRKKVMADPFLFNALLDAFDDVLLGAIKIAEGIRNAAQWATEMREENPEFTEYTDDQLEEIRQASQAYYDSNLKGILAEEKAPKEKKTTKEKKEAEATEAETEELESEEEGEKVFATFDDVTARDVYHMVRDRVQKGMTKVEDVMKSVTEELKKQLPDVTERQVRDRFSGYGNPLFPSGGDIAKKVRELRTLAQYASKIEDAQRKIAPLRAGKQREAATDAIRAAQKELYRLMKDNGLEMVSGNRAIKTPLDVLKSRLRNSIADLDRQIEAKKRDAKSTKVVERDTEAADLENKAKILREKLNEIDPPKQPSFQDKAKARMKSISKEIVSLRQKLANKDITKPESEPIINQQIQVLLNERDALKQAMDELRLEIEGEPYLTQDEINERAEKILDRNIKSLETEIKELQDPNFYPQPAQKAENTPTIIRLKAQQEVLRKQRDELKTQRFGKKTKSQEDLLDAAIASAEKSINDLNDRINREETATKARTPKFVETAKLRNLRAERNSLRSVMFAMRKAKAEAAKDPVLEQIKRDRKYLETRTKYYEDMADKLRNGTYKPKVKEARKFNDSLGAELKRLDDAKMRVADIMLQQRLKNRSSLRKAFDFIGDLFSLQRVITATADLSAIANQGNFILFSNPRIAMKAIPDMLRSMRTEEGEKEVQERIRNMPEYQNGEFKRAGLYLAMDAGPNAPLSKMEEQYASRLVAKWPKLLGGGLVRGSERAYKTFLDVIRATSYKVMKESLVTGSIFRPPQQSTQENLESLANLINNATGRGVFKMKKADQLLSQAAPFLNTFIFAARFGVSRFAMALGLPLWRASPQTRALIAEQYAKYIFGVYMATLLLSLGQDDDDEPIQLDFRSTDAGKLRFDDNRVDLLGGFQQPLVFLTRLLTGETMTSQGKVKPLRESDRPLDLFRDQPLKGKPSYGGMSGDSLIGSFLRFKLAPTMSSIINVMGGKDPVGNKTDLKSEIIKAPIPLQVSQIFEILGSQQDDPATAALLMGLGATGVRTTFQGKNAEKNKTAWDNMVNKVNELLGEK